MLCVCPRGGVLRLRFQKLEKEIPMECETCGGNGFLVCSWCGGDKKSMALRYGNSRTVAALKCTACNENGLTACPDCIHTLPPGEEVAC